MKRTPLKAMSAKMKRQLVAETRLTKQLLEQCGHKCEYCGVYGGVLKKHEIVLRSQGGDPLDENNCIILCIKDHNRAHRKDPKNGFISPGELQVIMNER